MTRSRSARARFVAQTVTIVAMTLALNGANATPVELVGVGATFPYSVYEEAMSAYEQAMENVTMTYRAFGSGSGLCRIKNRTVECPSDLKGTDEVDFACSDALLDPVSYSSYADLQMFPALAGAVAILYNLPGTTVAVNLNAMTIVGVFNGTITRWNDAALQALNPALSLPDEAIKVVVRADSSGTTEVFATALKTMDTDLGIRLGSDLTLPTWPMGSYEKRTSSIGVASYVRATNYSLGYAVLADANTVNASMAGYMHSGSFKPVFPTPQSISQAVKARGLQFGNNGDSPTRLTATISPVLMNDAAWPFTTYTYVVLRTGMVNFTTSDRLRANATCQNVRQTVAFWRWFLSSAQAYRIAQNYGFSPLRDEIGALVLARLIADTHCQGTRVQTSESVVESASTSASVTAPSSLNKVLASLRALLEGRNSSQTLTVHELTSADQAVENIMGENGVGIGLVSVGTPLAVLRRLPFFAVEARLGVHSSVLQMGTTSSALTLDAAATAAILSGDATTWGHAEIVRLNTFLSGVTAPIILVGINNPKIDSFYKTYIDQLVALNASFTLGSPKISAESYDSVAAHLVETSGSVALLPNDVIAHFQGNIDASSSLDGLRPMSLDVYVAPSASDDGCRGKKFQTLYTTLSMLEWMGTDTSVQAVIQQRGISTPFTSSSALETFLSTVRSVTCDGVPVLNPQTSTADSGFNMNPLVLALSIGLGLLTAAILFIFSGSIAKSFFIQTIVNQYKRSHPPSDEEVTIVVTDIQASSKLWHTAPVHMNKALAVHDKIMRSAIHQTYGYEVITEGDSFTVAFHTANDAIQFAMLIQERMQNYAWDAPIADACRQVYEENNEDELNQPAIGETRAQEILLQAVTSKYVIHEHEELKHDEDDEITFVDTKRSTSLLTPLGTGQFVKGERPRLNGLRVRIGMHTGFCQSRFHPTTRRKEYYKGAVTIAHAVSDCATGGQTVISSDTMAALTDQGKHAAQAFYALHMGRHELALSRKDLAVVDEKQHVAVDLRAELGAIVEDEAPLPATKAATLRLRRSQSTDSTESGTVEMYPAFRQTLAAKKSLMKMLNRKEDRHSTLLQSELVQVVPNSLSTRLMLFPGLRTVRQLEASYFDSPGLRDMRVTIVYTYVENLKSLRAALKDIMDESIEMLNATVRATLRFYNGYECRERDGEFLLAFHNPVDAYKWCLFAQTTFMRLDWPKKLLAHRSAKRVRNGRMDVFVGLRVSMGVCSGICSDIRPCARTGRTEYFGPILNTSARVAHAARGGQVLTDYETLEQAMKIGYMVEFCHDLGVYMFKGVNKPLRLIQVSDASLVMRPFEDTEALQVQEPIGLESERSISFHSAKDREFKSKCFVLCSSDSPVTGIVKSVVHAIHAHVEVIPVSSVELVVTTLRQMDTNRRISKHYVIVTDELPSLDITTTCRKIRRRLNLYMQPAIATYLCLVSEANIAEIGIDVVLPNLDSLVGGVSVSRDSYVDGESDSDEETNVLEFKQALEQFFSDDGHFGGNAASMISSSETAEIAPGVNTYASQRRTGAGWLDPARGTHGKPLLSMSSLGLLTTALDAVSAKAFAIDDRGELRFSTRQALKCGVGNVSRSLPSSEWLKKVSVVAARAQEGIVKQAWTESIKRRWLDEEDGVSKDIEGAVHRPLQIGDNLAIVLITWQT